MQVNSNSIIAIHGSAEATPAVHGCHGNFVFYQWLHFDCQENSMMKFEVHLCDYTPGGLYLNRHLIPVFNSVF